MSQDDYEISIPPIDSDLISIIDKLIEALPNYAVGAAWIEWDDIWRPIARSKSGNYYTKRTWKPLLGFQFRLLANKLRSYISWLGYRYCDWVGYMITRDKKIYVCCVYQPERNIYILFPRANVTLKILIEDLRRG